MPNPQQIAREAVVAYIARPDYQPRTLLVLADAIWDDSGIVEEESEDVKSEDVNIIDDLTAAHTKMGAEVLRHLIFVMSVQADDYLNKPSGLANSVQEAVTTDEVLKALVTKLNPRFVHKNVKKVQGGFQAYIGLFWMYSGYDTPRVLAYLAPVFEPLLVEARRVWLKHNSKPSTSASTSRLPAVRQFLRNVREVQKDFLAEVVLQCHSSDTSMSSTSSGNLMAVDSPVPVLASSSPAPPAAHSPVTGLKTTGLAARMVMQTANPSPGLPIRRHSTVDFATPDLSPSAFRPLFLPTLDAPPLGHLPPSGRLDFLKSRHFSDWPSPPSPPSVPPPSVQGPSLATGSLLPPFAHTSNPPGRENGLDAGTHSRVTSPSPDTRRDRPLTPLNGRTPEAGSPKKDKRPTSGKDSV
ncbi:hypothetical protein C8R44DRAFT_879174 [Mycena epipterygia]|nr:hypothetical protein C8R44DRAFT_879174 [Mycena epipterygia]